LKPTLNEEEVTFKDNNIYRFYDAVYKSVDLVIEVQENSRPHVNNVNDRIKQAQVVLNNKNMFYYKMIDQDIVQATYLSEKIKEIHELFIDAALNKSEVVRELYYMSAFKTHIQKLVDESDVRLQDPTLSPEDQAFHQNIKARYTSFLDGNKDNIMHKSYEMKRLLQTSKEKRIISVSDILDILNIDDEASINQINNEVMRLSYVYADKESMCVNWEGLCKLIIESKVIDNDAKALNLEYLLQSSNIYEEIITRMKRHCDSCCTSNKKMINILSRYTNQKKKEEYNKTLVDINQENQVLHRHVGILARKSKSVLKQSSNLLDMINAFDLENLNKAKLAFTRIGKRMNTSKTISVSRNDVEVVSNVVVPNLKLQVGKFIKCNNVLKLEFEKYKNKALTINYTEVGKSIYPELPNFEIVYTGKYTTHVNTSMFEAICIEHKIPKEIQRLAIKQYCLLFTKGRPDIIPRMTFRGDKSDVYIDEAPQIDDDTDYLDEDFVPVVNNHIPEETDTKESDEESEYDDESESDESESQDESESEDDSESDDFQ
jgi:hypothetical protein